MAEKKAPEVVEEKVLTPDMKEYWEEREPITLFRDNDQYKDDVLVFVNGESCRIKRGERVMVKRKFLNVIEESERRRRISDEAIFRAEAKYKEETENLAKN